MLLIKFGGSAITDKAVPFSVRREVVARAARELAIAREPVVLVHGAGSYGHPLAKEHRLFLGLSGNAVGWSRTQARLIDLSREVSSALLEAGLAPIYSPAAILAQEEAGRVAIDTASVRGWLARGFLPLLHGDALLVGPDQVRIASGDEIVALLARELSPRKVIFGCDVDGIYSEDPKRSPAARLQTRIERRGGAGTLKAGEVGDTTGGMKAKLATMLAMTGVPIQILSLVVPGRLEAAVSDEETVSTWIVD